MCKKTRRIDIKSVIVNFSLGRKDCCMVKRFLGLTHPSFVSVGRVFWHLQFYYFWLLQRERSDVTIVSCKERPLTPAAVELCIT